MGRDLLVELLEPPALADPYPLYARLRDHEPAHRLPSGEWVFTRYRDVLTVLRDPRFVRPHLPTLPVRAIRTLYRMFLLLDPPDHTRLRKIVARFFTPAPIAELRGRTVAYGEELLSRTTASGIDLIDEDCVTKPASPHLTLRADGMEWRASLALRGPRSMIVECHE